MFCNLPFNVHFILQLLKNWIVIWFFNGTVAACTILVKTRTARY